MTAKSLLFLTALAPCLSDLRLASQPRNSWKCLNRNRNYPFVTEECLYMEPSDFGYQGLKDQRQNAYDNFLRSNIDNEQDRRNFNEEPGKDHMPFRNYETMATDDHDSIETQLPSNTAITPKLDEPFVVPLRWNNPHAAEIEVNLWLMSDAVQQEYQGPVVVPVRRPACSGEGYQDNVFTFTIPKVGYANLKRLVTGFDGCNQIGDCVIQYYAHSVESRMYASGMPTIINFADWADTTSHPDYANIAWTEDNRLADVGLRLELLSRLTCLPGISYTNGVAATPDVQSLDFKPQKARLVSDVFNHAYQNSDFSPYAGQQPLHISRNLQASVILKMVPGNRGELGKKYFSRTNGEGAQLAQKVDRIARELVRVYETITNQIISAIGYEMETQSLNLTGTGQNTNRCFRCAEVGSVNKKRLITNTYIPSFRMDFEDAQRVPQGWCAEALNYLAPVYQNLIVNCHLQIYTAVLADVAELFVELGTKNVGYLGTVIKDTTTTMADATNFIKVDASGNNDGGYYAAEQAQKYISSPMVVADTFELANINPDKGAWSCSWAPEGRRRLNVAADTSQTNVQILNQTEQGNIEDNYPSTMNKADYKGLNMDTDCEDDTKWTEGMECHLPGYTECPPGQLFPDVEAGQDCGLINSASGLRAFGLFFGFVAAVVC